MDYPSSIFTGGENGQIFIFGEKSYGSFSVPDGVCKYDVKRGKEDSGIQWLWMRVCGSTAVFVDGFGYILGGTEDYNNSQNNEGNGFSNEIDKQNKNKNINDPDYRCWKVKKFDTNSYELFAICLDGFPDLKFLSSAYVDKFKRAYIFGGYGNNFILRLDF